MRTFAVLRIRYPFARFAVITNVLLYIGSDSLVAKSIYLIEKVLNHHRWYDKRQGSEYQFSVQFSVVHVFYGFTARMFDRRFYQTFEFRNIDDSYALVMSGYTMLRFFFQVPNSRILTQTVFPFLSSFWFAMVNFSNG